MTHRDWTRRDTGQNQLWMGGKGRKCKLSNLIILDGLMDERTDGPMDLWTDRAMDQQTNGLTDKASYRVACSQLRMVKS